MSCLFIDHKNGLDCWDKAWATLGGIGETTNEKGFSAVFQGARQPVTLIVVHTSGDEKQYGRIRDKAVELNTKAKRFFVMRVAAGGLSASISSDAWRYTSAVPFPSAPASLELLRPEFCVLVRTLEKERTAQDWGSEAWRCRVRATWQTWETGRNQNSAGALSVLVQGYQIARSRAASVAGDLSKRPLKSVGESSYWLDPLLDVPALGGGLSNARHEKARTAFAVLFGADHCKTAADLVLTIERCKDEPERDAAVARLGVWLHATFGMTGTGHGMQTDPL